MEHVVFYPSVDNLPAFRRLASLDEAVRFAEHLRNVEGVSDCSVYALSPVPLSFRAYYRAEIPADTVSRAPAAPTLTAVPDPVQSALIEAEPTADPAAERAVDQAAERVAEPVADVPPPSMPVADEALGAGSDGAKSLGFFAR